MTITLIKTQADLDTGLAYLAKVDPVCRHMLLLTRDIPLRLREPGFPGLAGIIVSQQISVASAKAIWARLISTLDPLTPEAVLAADSETLGRIGLSRPKQRGLRAIAEAIQQGKLPIENLHAVPAQEAHTCLIAVKGIGPWTADVFQMFCLGHADAFAAGDLALQEAARMAYRLAERPKPKTLLDLAEAWRPYRSVAARLLWAYYASLKSREGIT